MNALAINIIKKALAKKEIDPLTLVIYFKLLLDEFGSKTFESDEILLSYDIDKTIDRILLQLERIKENNPKDYEKYFGQIERIWKEEYDADGKLYVPDILGHLVTLNNLIKNRVLTLSERLDNLIGKIEEEGIENKRDNAKNPQSLATATINRIGDTNNIIIRESGSGIKVMVRETRASDTTISIPDDRINLSEASEIIAKYFRLYDIGKANKLMEINNNWDSVVIIIRRFAITREGQKKINIKIEDLRNIKLQKYENKKICESELFADEPSMMGGEAAIGTGFFINAHTIVTNGHVLTKKVGDDFYTDPLKYLRELRFIAGFDSTTKRHKTSMVIPKENVFEVDTDRFEKDYIGSTWFEDLRGEQADWALLPVRQSYKTTAEPKFVKISPTPPKESAKVYCIGHPLGLPKKFIFGGTQEGDTSSSAGIFYCSLDMVAGNSGSPVFDAETNELIGVLSGNDIHFPEDRAFDVLGDCIKMTIAEIGDNIGIFGDGTPKLYKGHIVQWIGRDSFKQMIEKVMKP